MSRVNHKRVKQLLNEKRSKITDRQFFTSRILAGHYEDLAAAQTRRYHYNRRIRVNLFWNAKNPSAACTDNNSILINAGHPTVTKVRGRENRYQIVTGMFAHELGHTTYSALLNLLTLSQAHRENLLSRGLSEEEITRLRYRTTPVMGHTAIAKQLQDQGCYLAGVPGFFRTEDGNWALTGLPRGILIPVRNVCGQIQGLQLRKDNSVKRKFRWVSSMGEKDGCGAECWTHLAGPAADTLILTEGPMKADVIHALTGLSVLAVPGVNGLSQLSETLTDLQRNHGLESIKTAFDMDYTSNYHVQTGYAALYALLDKLDLTYSTYLWDPRYKGLDDYIWESLLHKQRAN